jgi:hypothetical protein
MTVRKKRVRINRPTALKKPLTPRKARKLSPSPQTSQRVAKAIAKMRTEGWSLRRASLQVGVAPATVIKWASPTLRKNKRGRYGAKTTDSLLRTLMIPTPQGTEEIGVRGLSTASLLGRYWSAVHRYYETGDTSGLQKFRGQSVTAVDGKKYPLLTDLEILNRLGNAGEVSFESLYSRSE